MAITGSGFDGSVDETQFSKLMVLAGVRHAVLGSADYAATAVNGVRSVSISAGEAYGAGVLAVNDTAAVVALPTPSVAQWHLICLRRDWVLNTCSLVAIAGPTTTNVTPTTFPVAFPTMNTSAGIKDDQPLTWAWVNNTTTTVVLFSQRSLTVDARLAAVQSGLDTRLAAFQQTLDAALQSAGAGTRRAWRFARGGSDYDSFGAGYFAEVAGGAIPNAPAGDYLVTATVELTNTGTNVGYLRVEGGGINLSQDSRLDVGGSPVPYSYSDVVNDFPGGTFDTSLKVQVSAGTGTVIRNGTGIRVIYLGKSA